MLASLASKSFPFDFYDRHFNLLHYVFAIKYIPTKYLSQEVLTNIYLYGILLVKHISWRCEMEFWQERGLAIANSNTVKRNRLGYQVPSQSGAVVSKVGWELEF